MPSIVPARDRRPVVAASVVLALLGLLLLLPAAPPARAATGVGDGTGVGVIGTGTSGVGGGGSTTPIKPDPIAGGPVSPAPAGTFHVWGCRTPSGAPAPTDGWIRTSDFSSNARQPALAPCSEGGSLVLAAGDGTGIASNGLFFSAGAGLRLIDGALWRSARAVTDDTAGQHFASVVTYNLAPPAGTPTAIVGDPGPTADWLTNTGSLNTGLGGSGSMARGTSVDPFAAANRVWLGTFDPETQQASQPVGVYANCLIWNGDYACEARYQLWASDFRVVDRDAPRVTLAAGGLIDASGHLGASVSGTPTTTVAASDVPGANAAGSGIRRAVLEVDGRAIATAAPALTEAERVRCTPATASDGLPAYQYLRPCPSTAPIAFPWDSTTVSDGSHAVRLLIEDAAGNTAVAASGAITVRNAGSIGVGSPLELRGAANSPSGTDAGVVTVVWPSTARKASTRKAVVHKCQAKSYAKAHELECKGRAAATGTALDWSGSKRLAGEVRLVDGDGHPLAGAVVKLTTTATATGAATTDLATVTTAADGTADFSVPVADGSRTVEARWYARTLDTRPAATGTATLTVTAASSLKAPRRASPGDQVRFSGQLRGQAGARGQVPVHLEVKSGGAWKTFTTATTDNDGTWSKRLKFAKTPGTYRVRVRIGSSATYPYAAGGTDDTISVVVR